MSVQPTIQPQSPQKVFACLCGRLYQSYAAVYTHIRNKHQRDQNYINGIKRPACQQKHRKGRPKKTSKGFFNKEIEEIHIFELGLYKLIESIQQVLPNSSSGLLLKGNQSLNSSCIDQNYDDFSREYPLDFNILKSGNPNPIYTQIKTFYTKFVKHLDIQINCKILWTLNKLLSYQYMSLNSESLDISFKSIPQSLLKEVWFGTVEPVKVIIETFRQFMKHSQLEHQNQNEYLEELLQMNEKQQCSSQINQFLMS